MKPALLKADISARGSWFTCDSLPKIAVSDDKVVYMCFGCEKVKQAFPVDHRFKCKMRQHVYSLKALLGEAVVSNVAAPAETNDVAAPAETPETTANDEYTHEEVIEYHQDREKTYVVKIDEKNPILHITKGRVLDMATFAIRYDGWGEHGWVDSEGYWMDHSNNIYYPSTMELVGNYAADGSLCFNCSCKKYSGTRLHELKHHRKSAADKGTSCPPLLKRLEVGLGVELKTNDGRTVSILATPDSDEESL